MAPSNPQQEEESLTSLGERIARLVHAHFDRLPPRSKPILRDDGTREWMPMCGVVVVREGGGLSDGEEEELTCVAVTSGAKCLPSSQLPNCTGLVLHDWHAEILALRAFNHWLLSEVRSILTSPSSSSSSSGPSSESKSTPSKFIQRRTTTSNTENGNMIPFELNPTLKIYLYCTTAPCGDASMELTMAAQDDPTPWEILPSSSSTTPTETKELDLLTGRGHFSRLGIVRRKPARADAPSTLSKSCSDKLALRQVSSLISAEMGLLVNVTPNVYLAGVVMPASEVSAVGCERAFGSSGRMAPLIHSRSQSQYQGEGGDRYHYHPFSILPVEDKIVNGLWQYGKPTSRTDRCKPGTISAVWTAAPSLLSSSSSGGGGDGIGDVYAAQNGAKQLPKLYGSQTGLYETIINGMKQGFKASAPVGKGASALSRARMWGGLRDLALSVSLLGSCEGSGDGDETGEVEEWVNQVNKVAAASSYAEFKRAMLGTPAGRARQRAISEAKKVLVPWVPNEGDDEWGLDVLTIDNKGKKRKR
ncbi:hypothetical protein BO94DRAFT_507068 [Aspergillus sclerotioniger CBS 115572]|uniref:A to I editase domain-containing protein n=1 Tax=Aspergillus sclerotioniger CBS 115572 TaxID=1450535 RepID=A0A317XDV9_9EURO|nr:hypothetical protein BO94DRAFT_507068 [Aspergillus sclerotioniger CBS 115572]PWY95797.1 hypothetical protein BO94DRAFT_507068 [Aspergillus sclerotioniger CBS 115572]